MRNKCFKILGFLLTIMLIFQLVIPFSYAGMLDNAKKESGHSPYKKNEDTSSGSIEQKKSEVVVDKPSDKTITIPHHVSISGNVYEDLGLSTENSQSYIGIEDVLVTAYNDENEYSAYTDANGNYTITPDVIGDYYLKFTYGSISDCINDGYSAEAIKNVMKYNGYDYIVTDTPAYSEEQKIYVDEITVKISKKGVCQVILAVDISYSMRNSMVNINGVEQTRLQVAVDAAKKLSSSLLNEGKNIYIGVVGYDGYAYRAAGLSKNESFIHQALDSLKDANQTPNTDITAAFDKCIESFYNNDKATSNRAIVLISDGIPTSDGVTQVYCDDSDSEVKNKLYNIIKPNTEKRIDEVVNDGVNVFTLLVKPTDNEELNFVTDIFNGRVDEFMMSDDYEQLAEILNRDVNEWAIEHIQTSQYTVDGYSIEGFEDSGRREEVDKLFENYFYYNYSEYDKKFEELTDEEKENISDLASVIYLFKNVDQYSSEKLADIMYLSEKTYMTCASSGTYTIEEKADSSQDYVEYYYEIHDIENDTYTYETTTTEEADEITETTEKTLLYRIFYVNQDVSYGGQNLTLAQRPAVDLKVNLTATNSQVILSTGEILNESCREMNSDLPIIESLEADIAQGATIRIEYEVLIKNNSPYQCNYLELVQYLPDGFVFTEDERLISQKDVSNSDIGWVRSDVEYLYNKGIINEDSKKKYQDSDCAQIYLSNYTNDENSFYIPSGGEYKLKIVCSKVLSSELDMSIQKQGATEITCYKTNSNRRMASLASSSNGSITIGYLVGVYPGDTVGDDYSDTSDSVYVIPPTGLSNIEDRKRFVLISLMLASMISLGVLLKKRYINKK